jgi:hypothetical protein
MIPRNVYVLCQGGLSVSAELAKNPIEAPNEAAKRLFGRHADNVKPTKDHGPPSGLESDLDQARRCGNWGRSQPSELFLKASNGPIPEGYWTKLMHMTDISRCARHPREKSIGWSMLAITHG